LLLTPHRCFHKNRFISNILWSDNKNPGQTHHGASLNPEFPKCFLHVEPLWITWQIKCTHFIYLFMFRWYRIRSNPADFLLSDHSFGTACIMLETLVRARHRRRATCGKTFRKGAASLYKNGMKNVLKLSLCVSWMKKCIRDYNVNYWESCRLTRLFSYFLLIKTSLWTSWVGEFLHIFNISPSSFFVAVGCASYYPFLVLYLYRISSIISTAHSLLFITDGRYRSQISFIQAVFVLFSCLGHK
jgi:hypothetical protein